MYQFSTRYQFKIFLAPFTTTAFKKDVSNRVFFLFAGHKEYCILTDEE